MTEEPALNGQAEDDAPARGEGRGELVLVVDDEDFILEMMQEALESNGFRACTARDGAEALRLYEERREEIDVVVTDLMMPDVDGIAVIEEIRRQDAELPVVAASALSGEKPEAALASGADAFLSKPYTAEQLSALLREVLGAETEKA